MEPFIPHRPSTSLLVPSGPPNSSATLPQLSSIVRAKVWAHKRIIAQRGRRRLWDEAFEQLSTSDAANLTQKAGSRYARPDEIVATIHERLEEAEKKSWKYTRSNGDVVVLRDVLEKTLKWIERFQSVVNAAVSYDVSGHAAAPWAMIKFLLSTGFSSIKTGADVIEAVEYISKIVTLYTEVELRSLCGTSRLKSQLATSLVILYASILTCFAKARDHLTKSSAKRFAKGIVQSSDMIIGVWIEKVKIAEQDVMKVRELVDVEDQRNLLVGVKNSLDMHMAGKVTQRVTDSSRRAQLKQWLGATLTSDTLSNARTARSTGTCDWFLQRDAFQRWDQHSSSSDRERRAKLLWIHAGPGFGKTVLSARIVDHLQNTTTTPLAYFFVVSEDKSRHEPCAILRSWIFQIANSDIRALEKVHAAYKNNSRTTPASSELWEIFTDLIDGKRYGFIVDGYDECTTVNKESKYHTADARSQFLRSLISTCTNTESQFLVVSRDQEDIRTALESAKTRPQIMYAEYSISSADTRADVLAFSRIVTSDVLAHKANEFREEIATEAADRADGLFLWIHLLRQKLGEERGQNLKQLRAAVSSMPDGIDSAYEQELVRLLDMKGDRKERARAVLRWVLFATRPMTVRELAEALTLSSASALDRYPTDELPDEWARDYVDEDYVNSNIRLCCGSLVELRSPREGAPLALHTVHFVHFSVKEFLLRPIHDGSSRTRLDLICFPDAASEHDRLARLCLQYLCYDVFGESHRHRERFRRRMRLYPFLQYAAKSWPSHALTRRVMSSDVGKIAQKLFSPDTQNWRVWSEVFESVSSPDPEEICGGSNLESSAERYSPSEGDSEGDSEGGTDDLSSSDSEWSIDTDNGKGGGHGHSGTASSPNALAEEIDLPGPIYYAAWLGLTDIIKTLQGVDLSCDCLGGRYGTPLQAAVVSGQEDTVSYLIDQNVDVSREGGWWGSAIAAAVGTGSLRIVHALVDSGADLRRRDRNERNLLHLACSRGDAAMTAALLEFDESQILLEETSSVGETPLHEAVESGNLALVKLLLQRGPDVNLLNRRGESPLVKALYGEHEDIVRELVRSRADVTLTLRDGASILHLAARQGMHKFVKSLMGRQADVSAQDGSGWTALHFAASAHKSRREITKALIEHGASVDAATEAGYTPLHVATQQGHEDVAVLLLENGASVDALTSASVSALLQAVYFANDAIVRVLLEHHADPGLESRDEVSPLDEAIHTQKQAIIELLLSYGAVTNISHSSLGHKTSEATTNLQISLSRNEGNAVLAALHSSVSNADSNPIDLNSLLLAAAMFGAESTSSWLLAHGADPCSTGEGGRSLLHIAAFGGHVALVQNLLNRGDARVCYQDAHGARALDRAVKRGEKNRDVIDALIKHGAMDLEEAENENLKGLGEAKKSTDEREAEFSWRETLEGRWTGHYIYSSWNKGVKEPTSVSFVSDEEPHKNRMRFSGKDIDRGSPFSVQGQIMRGGIIRWIKLYPEFGWIYAGMLDEGGKVISGRWGSSMNAFHGSFVLRRE